MAIQLNLCDVKVYNNRGIAYSQKSEFDLAIADYNTAIELNPQFALVYYNRGEAWLRLREWEKAKSRLDHCQENGYGYHRGHSATITKSSGICYT